MYCIASHLEVGVKKLVINGGVPLFGRVRVSGSKNAALPIIFSSLALRSISRIKGLADIGDVRVALDLIGCYGAKVKREGRDTLIDTTTLKYVSPPPELTSMLRASTYLMGASLIRFGRAELVNHGGCNFSARPIDMHLDALASHGAVIAGDVISGGRLVPSVVRFKKRSVGATVNALISAAGIEGESVIEGCALEPHIFVLVDYLRSAGASISFVGDRATVRGGELSGAEVSIPGDMIEAGSYVAASIASGGRVQVQGFDRSELSSFIEALGASGVSFEDGEDVVAYGKPARRFSVCAAPYPGFPTDLQPVVAPLMSFAGGCLKDEVWRERFGYLDGLGAFGLRSRALGDMREVFPSELHPARAYAPDLRGGFAMLLAALMADGESEIYNADVILRGYENITEKLSGLGAEISLCEM